MRWEYELIEVIIPRNELLNLHLRRLKDGVLEKVDDSF